MVVQNGGLEGILAGHSRCIRGGGGVALSLWISLIAIIFLHI